MGGAQPLAATMNGALFLGVDVDPTRIEKRLKSGYCDKIAWSLDDALGLDIAGTDWAIGALGVGILGAIGPLARRALAQRSTDPGASATPA